MNLIAFVERRPYAALALIVLIGLAVRLYLLPTAGFIPDLEQHYHWALCGQRDGVLAIYNCEVGPTHPPLSPVMLTASLTLIGAFGGDISYFADNPAVVFALKLPNLLFETALIILVFKIALEKAGWKWAAFVTAALYWSLGWLTVTAWWGQNDSTYTFFMLLAAYWLTKDRPRLVWIAYGAAWLAKFQSIVFFPVLAVICWRRYGLRPNLEGAAMGAALFGIVVLPFLIGSGESALRPFVGTVNLFPYITNGAFNAWYWISGSSPIVIEDRLLAIGGLTYRAVGLIALGGGTLMLCLRAWRLADRRDEYLLLAAANLTFFFLPTQIQARYMYPGLVLLALAMIRDRRLIALYVGLSITFMDNVFAVVWQGVGLLYYPAQAMFWNTTVTALAATAFYAIFMVIFLRPLFKDAPRSQPSQRTTA